MDEQALLIHIGIIIAGRLDSIDAEAVKLATSATKQQLTEDFSAAGLQFEFSLARRPEMLEGTRARPSLLLRQAQEERDSRHWDFAFVVTAAELFGRYSSSSCFAALSRPLDAAVFSTSLIDPISVGTEVEPSQRTATVSHRLSRLMLRAVGHLVGLGQVDDPENLMFRPRSTADLDCMRDFDQEQVQRGTKGLLEVADPRLEERYAEVNLRNRFSRCFFLIRAAYINRREISEAVWAARPWQFPGRLSGLTVASVSTLLVLMLTAEAWDLALSQTLFSIFLLAAIIGVATTLYVTARQQLLIRRRREDTEQNVVTVLSAILIVGIGMCVTWLMLFGLGTAIASLFFSSSIIIDWSQSNGSPDQQIGIKSRLAMSAFSSSWGLFIGALGASFESQDYFQHVIFVDEEL